MKKNKLTIILFILVAFLIILNIYNKYNIKQAFFEDIYSNFRNLEVVINNAQNLYKDYPEIEEIILAGYTYDSLYEETYSLKLSLDFGQRYIDNKLASSNLRETMNNIENLKNKELTKDDYDFLDSYYHAVLDVLNEMTEGGEYSIILIGDINNIRDKKLWRSDFNYIIEKFNNHMVEYFRQSRR